MSTLRVLLADDHGVLRAGLRALINEQPDMEVVGEAGTADEVCQAAHQTQPTIALVDIRMPGDGLTAVRRLKHDLPSLAVLVLSQYDDPAYLRQALAAGAAGYILKSAPGHDLLSALRAVANGNVYLDPAIARVLVEESWGPRSTVTPVAVQPLSERETEVLRLVALGYTTQQIAEQLFLGVRTVETYKVRGMDKLGLKGRAALVRYALEHGLLETDPAQ